MDFIVDTVGDEELIEKDEVIGEVNENDFEKVGKIKLFQLLNKITLSCKQMNADKQTKTEKQNKCKDYKTENLIDKFFTDVGWSKDPQFGSNKDENDSGKKKKKKNINKVGLERFTNIDLETGKFKMKAAQVDLTETLKKTVLTPGIEKEYSMPEYDVSNKRQRALKKAEKDKTKGPLWYNIPAPEITEELKTDLELLKMRSVMDPKHFYKKNDMEALPKYFQVGTVMDSPLDHQNVKLTRKERKKTLVDELLADAQFKKFNKRKYSEIVEEKRKSTYKTYIKDKRMKRKQLYKQNKQDGEGQNKRRKTSN